MGNGRFVFQPRFTGLVLWQLRRHDLASIDHFPFMGVVRVSAGRQAQALVELVVKGPDVSG
ncbi:hypothetical protein C9I99_09170 [Photobacterium lutimaris]|uniref:Uncharacterized protein n=1 Tax=Photobacterium lutimaris TaxID=388278 RepID=A0A2T3IZN8_9GAMM|nr:hypothetical protein C9I99_09170 [Photobacterium lutimaris]